MSAYGTKVVAVIEPRSEVGVKINSLFGDVQNLKNQMTTLLSDAPETLDTLNEIAAAISDDPAFFSTMSTANTTLQTNIDALSTAAATARTALQTFLQAAIDANKLTSDNAETALSGRLDTLESDPTTATALAAVSGRVATLETDPTTKTYVDNAVAGLVDGAGSALDTLNELSAALGDDANFATTVTNQIAAVQADVNQNEADADAAIAAANVAMLAAVAAVQADVDQNETDADTAIALKANIASPTFTGTVGGITKSMVGLGNVDNTADTAKPVSTAQQTAIDAVQADVDQNESDADAAIAAVQADVDQNEADADAAIALKFDKAGGSITGNFAVAKSFPDIELKAGDEKRLLFSDAGGGSTGAIKHVSTSLDFYASGIASGNKEFSVTADGIEVTNGVTLLNGLTDAANDSAAATAGVAVGQLYRNGSVVMIRVS